MSANIFFFMRLLFHSNQMVDSLIQQIFEGAHHMPGTVLDKIQCLVIKNLLFSRKNRNGH